MNSYKEQYDKEKGGTSKRISDGHVGVIKRDKKGKTYK
jgi:hypothetical protein